MGYHGAMESIAIIGGGAAGLAGAVAAAQALRAAGRSDVEVALCEADERVGRTILATGNGRCNFSNASVRASDYRNAAFVGSVLQSLQGWSIRGGCTAGREAGVADPVHRFFADAGLLWREESEGRLYPQANKATSVLDVLRAKAARLGVRERTSKRAVRIDAPSAPEGPFAVRFDDGSVMRPRAVVLAMGGKHGLAVELPPPLRSGAPSPVLGPLRSDGRLTRTLNNIRLKAALCLCRPDEKAARDSIANDVELRSSALAAAAACGEDVGHADGGFRVTGEGLLLARQQGEVLFRDYGLSGIAVFNLSRFARPGDAVLVDALPGMGLAQAQEALGRRFEALVRDGAVLSGEDWGRGMLLPAVGALVLKQAGLSVSGPFAAADVPAFVRAAKALRFPVEGMADPAQCQVARGGLDIAAFDGRTLEARAVPGLFAAGEALDVDGPCGGYNLHWAWASGIVAGDAAARKMVAGKEA